MVSLPSDVCDNTKFPSSIHIYFTEKISCRDLVRELPSPRPKRKRLIKNKVNIKTGYSYPDVRTDFKEDKKT